MRFGWPRFHKSKPEAPVAPDPAAIGEERAYLIIEKLRLRCEQLLLMVSTHAQAHELRRVHRELGMAGLVVSTEMPAPVRLSLLTGAHEQSQRLPDDAEDGIEALALSLGEAEQAVSRVVPSRGRSDHLHLAHVHLLYGREQLEEYLAGAASRTDTIQSRP